MNVALHNLMSNETIDSTKDIPISNLDSLPVITFCPRQQVNAPKIDELGYGSGGDSFSIMNILKGKDNQK